MGFAVRNMVTCAKSKQTLVCGLLPAITQIEKSPEDVVFCLLPESTPGDAATHIQTVLLQAVCYENYIPVIQVRYFCYKKLKPVPNVIKGLTYDIPAPCIYTIIRTSFCFFAFWYMVIQVHFRFACESVKHLLT